MNNLDIAKITAKHIATIKLVPKSYIKHDCIKITYGFNVLINGKKYPRARGEHYCKNYWQCRGGENARTNKKIRELLRQGTIIGTQHQGPATLQYGKIRDIELVITVSNPGCVVLKVEEF
jgi:hypothetical protein